MIIDKIVAFVIGSCLGSFLNVCIYRLPKEKSIVRPRSACPQCKAPIGWFDNIPIVSYLVLRGKCRNCRSKISIRYPLVELITACLLVFLYSKFAFTLDFFRFAFFFALLVVVSFIDIEYHAIPVQLCFIGIIAGLVFSMQDTIVLLKSGYRDNLPLFGAVKGLIFGLGFTYLFKFFGDVLLSVYLSLIKKPSIEGETEALGLGDVDFMGMVGVFLGTKLVITTFFIAPFIALLYSIIAIIFKKSHLIPYLPYLSLAALISFLWGKNILGYFGL